MHIPFTHLKTHMHPSCAGMLNRLTSVEEFVSDQTRGGKGAKGSSVDEVALAQNLLADVIAKVMQRSGVACWCGDRSVPWLQARLL